MVSAPGGATAVTEGDHSGGTGEGRREGKEGRREGEEEKDKGAGRKEEGKKQGLLWMDKIMHHLQKTLAVVFA